MILSLYICCMCSIYCLDCHRALVSFCCFFFISGKTSEFSPIDAIDEMCVFAKHVRMSAFHYAHFPLENDSQSAHRPDSFHSDGINEFNAENVIRIIIARYFHSNLIHAAHRTIMLLCCRIAMGAFDGKQPPCMRCIA